MIERSRGRLATAMAVAGIVVGMAGLTILWPEVRSAHAGDLYGPSIGSGKVDSVLESLTDRPDTDDYTAELMHGETSCHRQCGEEIQWSLRRDGLRPGRQRPHLRREVQDRRRTAPRSS